MRNQPVAVVALAGADRTLRQAADAFLTQPHAPTTRRTYGTTLDRLTAVLGPDRPLADLGAEEFAAAVEGLWGARAPRTWNRQVATIRSCSAGAAGMTGLGDLTLRIDRRRVPDDDTKTIPAGARAAVVPL